MTDGDTARQRLVFLAREATDDMEEALAEFRLSLDDVDGPYRAQIEEAVQYGAELLAAAATGDEEALPELRMLKAQLLLWSWANAEAQRKAYVRALRAWLTRAAQCVGDLALEVIEAGVGALVQAGLDELQQD